MKNHWLDKKIDKEIDAAFEEIVNEKAEFVEGEFVDSDVVDLSAVMNRDGPSTRYKEYERLVNEEEKGEPEDVDIAEYDLDLAMNLVNAHKDDVTWLSQLLCHIATLGMERTYTSTVSGDLNTSITVHAGIPENLNVCSESLVMPGGDGIILGDVTVGGC